MRGKGSNYMQESDVIGITPAYAGKSFYFFSNLRHCQDHPRLCGEKDSSHATKTFILGSPPPMRGKGPPVADMWKRSGITPAYAGKSGNFRRL